MYARKERRAKEGKKWNNSVSKTKTERQTERGRLRERDQRAGDRRTANDK